MRLRRLTADRIINLDALADVSWGKDAKGAQQLVVTFTAPEADSRGASAWVTSAREIVLRGGDADLFWNFCVQEAEDDMPHGVGGYDS